MTKCKSVWLQEREAVDEAAAPLAEAVEDGEVVHSHRQVRRGLEGVVTQVVTMEDGEEDGGRIHKLCQFRFSNFSESSTDNCEGYSVYVSLSFPMKRREPDFP